MDLLSWVGVCVAGTVVLLAVLTLRVVVLFALGLLKNPFRRSCLYLGRVKHTRLRTAHHQLDYPLFLSHLDVEEVREVGWSWWPIFAPNAGRFSFCSLEDSEHLKGQQPAEPSSSLYNRVRTYLDSETRFFKRYPRDVLRVTLLSHLTYFGYCFNPVSFFYLMGRDDDPINTSSQMADTILQVGQPCEARQQQHSFPAMAVLLELTKREAKVRWDVSGRQEWLPLAQVNPLTSRRALSPSPNVPRRESKGKGGGRSQSPSSSSSSRSSSRRSGGSSGRTRSHSHSKDSARHPDTPPSFDEEEKLLGIICEVSNTPWGEMHPYLLHASVPGVDLTVNDSSHCFQASWRKAFHVSPFMEMGYRYTFSFSRPGLQQISVSALMHRVVEGDDKSKQSGAVKSGPELSFTASFLLDRVAMTPLALLYVLAFYPFHTRIIQVWIHVEAVKLWWKGVPFFPHPNGTDVDFGYGITGERLLHVFVVLMSPVTLLLSSLLRLLPSSSHSKKQP